MYSTALVACLIHVFFKIPFCLSKFSLGSSDASLYSAFGLKPLIAS